MSEKLALLRDQEETSFYDGSSFRIILVGKTGPGKSSTGNTILGREAFHAEISGNAVTRVCQKVTETTENTRISVIDTPGFCGSMSNEDMQKQVEECVERSVPGPHAFLLVIKVGRFTQEEQNAVKFIEKNFGENALSYTIVIFTHVDQLKTKPLTKYIEETKGLRELIRSCSDRYHGFNNENIENRLQVTQLLQMIEQMVRENGGTHYTNEIFKKAQNKLKWKEGIHMVKEVGSVAGLVIAGAAVVGGVGAGVGALAGAAVVGAIITETAVATGAIIGAGVVGGVGGVAGGVAGGVVGIKPKETFEQ